MSKLIIGLIILLIILAILCVALYMAQSDTAENFTPLSANGGELGFAVDGKSGMMSPGRRHIGEPFGLGISGRWPRVTGMYPASVGDAIRVRDSRMGEYKLKSIIPNYSYTSVRYPTPPRHLGGIFTNGYIADNTLTPKQIAAVRNTVSALQHLDAVLSKPYNDKMILRQEPELVRMEPYIMTLSINVVPLIRPFTFISSFPTASDYRNLKYGLDGVGQIIDNNIKKITEIRNEVKQPATRLYLDELIVALNDFNTAAAAL